MKQIIGYYKKVGVGREYGALIAYLQENVTDRAEANYVVFLIGSIVYVCKLKDGEEFLVACASNFSFKTDMEYNY